MKNRHKSASANGDFLEWMEYEADVARGTCPDDSLGMASPGSLTNSQMVALIHKQSERRRAAIAQGQCCNQMTDDGWCYYLCAMCPEVVAAMDLLEQTRGI